MKGKLLFVMLGLLALSSCSKTEGGEIAPTPENVEFTVNFGFAESGSLTRSGASVYDDFYTKYIKTKELTPETYTLYFKQGDATIAMVKGNWESDDIITLPAGKYTVTGNSGSDSYYSEIAQLSFNQDIEISSNTTNVNLTANYNCYLIIIGENTLFSPHYYSEMYSESNRDIDLYPKDNIYYMFFAYNLSENDRVDYICNFDRTSFLYLDEMTLEKGSYYYFDTTTGSFDIPPMTAGI